MQVSMLKSVMETTKEFAIFPTPITWNLPHYIEQASLSHRRGCPLGVPKGTIIEDGATYVEMQRVGTCGDKEYPINRRNGVLVQFSLSDLNQEPDEEEVIIFGKRGTYDLKGNELYYGDQKLPYTTEVVDGVFRMVVSRKAIIAPWGEYSLIAAQIEKNQTEAKARQEHLLTAQAQLMGIDPTEWITFRRAWGDDVENKAQRFKWKSRFGQLGANYEKIYNDENGDALKENEVFSVGQIEITVDQAEKIWNMLTPKQRKQLRDESDK